MTAAELKTTYDQAFPSTRLDVPGRRVDGAAHRPAPASPPWARGPTDYCAVSQNGSWYAWKLGPGGQILVSQTLDNVCTTAP